MSRMNRTIAFVKEMPLQLKASSFCPALAICNYIRDEFAKNIMTIILFVPQFS
jgi:hypothetical protein